MGNSRIGRRQFLQRSGVSVALAASSGEALGLDSPSQSRPAGGRNENLTTDADVLVVGGGTAGTIAAGRCVSSDRLANSGLRVQASCMAMGQAAGAAAALAVQKNTTPLDVPLEEIRKLLRKHGAIVPGP